MNIEIPLTDAEKRTRVFFVSSAFVLLSIIIIALVYLATSSTTAATATLSFAGGVSNIFLPCTLPLLFVIVPMSMGMGYRKGLTMALLFGLGLIIPWRSMAWRWPCSASTWDWTRRRASCT